MPNSADLRRDFHSRTRGWYKPNEGLLRLTDRLPQQARAQTGGIDSAVLEMCDSKQLKSYISLDTYDKKPSSSVDRLIS